jgi:hypothetical protein
MYGLRKHLRLHFSGGFDELSQQSIRLSSQAAQECAAYESIWDYTLPMASMNSAIDLFLCHPEPFRVKDLGKK